MQNLLSYSTKVCCYISVEQIIISLALQRLAHPQLENETNNIILKRFLNQIN